MRDALPSVPPSLALLVGIAVRLWFRPDRPMGVGDGAIEPASVGGRVLAHEAKDRRRRDAGVREAIGSGGGRTAPDGRRIRPLPLAITIEGEARGIDAVRRARIEKTRGAEEAHHLPLIQPSHRVSASQGVRAPMRAREIG